MQSFCRDKHVAFVRDLDKHDDTFEYWASEHLKLSGMYWGLSALALMDALPVGEEREKALNFVRSCKSSKCAGFGGNVGHDAHLLYTLSAVQIFCLFEEEDSLDVDGIADFVASMQQPDGSFWGDQWGETDTRFSYVAFLTLSLLKRLDRIRVDDAVAFIMRCKNFDEAFGVVPQTESHAGQVFCCVGALSLVGQLHRLDIDRLGWWLAERQLPCGGLNGRPEKKEDVCYSWWVLSSLQMLDRAHWIDSAALARFILSCQDDDNGGISDRPGNTADVFHLYFGVCGLAMLSERVAELKQLNLNQVDPAYALPKKTVERLKKKN